MKDEVSRIESPVEGRQMKRVGDMKGFSKGWTGNDLGGSVNEEYQ